MSWPRPIRVVGVGSSMGDDALAWEVVKRLRQARVWPGEIEFHEVEGGQRLLDVLDGRGSLILIDAMAAENTPGALLRFTWPNPTVEVLRPGSTHHLRPAEALHLAAALGLLPVEVVIWGIEGAAFAPQAPISVAVSVAIPHLVEQVASELQQTLAQEKN